MTTTDSGIGSFRLADDAHTRLVAAFFDANPVVHGFGFGHLDAADFSVLVSAAREYPTTRGARLGGVGGRAFTTFRMTVMASAQAILAFQQGAVLGWAEFSPEAWSAIADLDFRPLHQVHPVTGDITYPAEASASVSPR